MIRQRNYFLPLLGMIAFIALNLLNLLTVQAGAAGTKPQVSRFTEIYEPSTVVQLAPGWVIIAEDEGEQPLFLARVVDQGSGLKLDAIRLKEIDDTFADIEGSAQGKDGEVYLITSHSTNKKGKRKEKREILTRLTFKDGKISEKAFYGDLFLPIKNGLESEPEIDAAKSQQLNIEGLSFDSSKTKLLLGLRAPLVADKAVILVLENPYAIFSEGQAPRFQQKKIYLDIGGGGIRSITYDSSRKVYLIANEIPKKKGKKKGKLRPALWAWDGKPDSQAVRVPLPKLKGIKNIEGIAFVTFQKKTSLLMVCDDGEPEKKKGGHYIFLDISNLEY